MLLLLVGAFCIGCKERPAPEPYTNIVTVVKLKEPTWRNYIISVMYPDKSRIGASAYNVVDDSVKTPYRELPNDYLLVDWRWYRFPVSPVCLVFEPWENYTGFYYQRNPDSVKYQLDPLKCYIVDMGRVNALLQTENKYETEYSEACTNHPNAVEYKLQMSHMDSVWSITQQQLATIIDAGRFDDIAEQRKY